MLTTLVLLASLSGPPAVPAATRLDPDRSRVSVWTDRGDDPYQTGRSARVFVRADRDAYVTIFRVDTDGQIRVLFPHDPWEDNFVRGGREFEVQDTRDDDAFYIDDYPGVGYIFAVASPDPFEYDAISSGDRWDYRAVSDGRVRGDPYVALTDLAQRIVPENNSDWDYDLVPYYVERHYDYPRFLCYDCHSYASYSAWDPYAYSCVRFRIVVFDDPYYYPYRYYGGSRVVFTRPLRPEPRFIFKDRDGVGDDRFVTHARERERPENGNTRRGVRGVDIGARGSIPVPATRRRNSDDGWLRRFQPPTDRPGTRDRDSDRSRSNDRPDWRSRGSDRRDDGSAAQSDDRGHRNQPGDDQSRRQPPDDWRGRRPNDDQPRQAPDDWRNRRPTSDDRSQRQQQDDARGRRPSSDDRPQRQQSDDAGSRRPSSDDQTRRPPPRDQQDQWQGRGQSNASPPRESNEGRRAEPDRGRNNSPPKKDDSNKPEVRRRRP
ncbi:MAG TPA: DUF4384 domain-containing protein [Gemmatimonadales bacterium]|nr:DUF4384 domain-containing protein [Gemmatimonadales bacterium]